MRLLNDWGVKTQTEKELIERTYRSAGLGEHFDLFLRTLRTYNSRLRERREQEQESRFLDEEMLALDIHAGALDMLKPRRPKRKLNFNSSVPNVTSN